MPPASLPFSEPDRASLSLLTSPPPTPPASNALQIVPTDLATIFPLLFLLFFFLPPPASLAASETASVSAAPDEDSAESDADRQASWEDATQRDMAARHSSLEWRHGHESILSKTRT